MTPDDDQGAPPHWFAERATARYPNGWRYLCDDPEREHGYNPALGGIVHRDDYSACGWGLAPTALAPGEGDAKLAGNSAPDDLTEWECPNCGATTRARMADHPTAPDDLQREIGQALETARCAHHASDACYDCEAAAVMDVLRRRGLVT